MGSSILVLVVEDEAAISQLVEHALEDSGFAVVKAGNGDEAFAMLALDHLQFHALVSDIQLGFGPTGWDVSRLAREHNEDLPVVYMSGNNAQEWQTRGVPNSLFVAKPFAPAQIVTAVSQLLRINQP